MNTSSSTTAPDGRAGRAIRVMRNAQYLTIRDLARLSGTSGGYISQVERGLVSPSDRWLWSITTALGQHLGAQHLANTHEATRVGS